VPSWIDGLKSRLRPAAPPNGPEIYRDLRSLALGLDPASIDVPDGESWTGAAVAAMELNIAGAITTIVAVADGSTSMYLSSGGGVIGAGEHAAVRAVAERFRTVATDLLGLFVRTSELPTPDVGEVRFQVRTSPPAR